MRARVILTGDEIDVIQISDNVFSDVEGNIYDGNELELLPAWPIHPDLRELRQAPIIQPAASIAVEFMRTHPNAPAKKVLAFVTEVINGIKEL